MSRLNTGYLCLWGINSRRGLVRLVMVVVGGGRVLDVRVVVLVVRQGLREGPRGREGVRVVLGRHLSGRVGRYPVQLPVPFRMVDCVLILLLLLNLFLLMVLLLRKMLLVLSLAMLLVR